jgi:hypothetical protein
MLLPQTPEFIKQLGLSLIFFDDFITGPSSTVYTHLAADTTATVTNAGIAGGAVKLTTDATDNNEAAIATSNSLLFAQDKPFYVQGRVRWQEANTDDANVYFGVMDSGAAANAMVDNGAGPKTTASAAGFFKVDGGTVWKTLASKSTTQTINTTEHTSPNSATVWHTLGIFVSPIDSVNALVTYYIDTAGGNNLMPVRIASTNVRVPDAASNQCSIVISSAAAMGMCFIAKAGGANSETPVMDYWSVYGTR